VTFRAALLAGVLALPLPVLGQAAPVSLEASLDQIITRSLARTHVPGAVVAVVRDGRVLFLKGYGFADLTSRRPVVPDRTVFRVGSVSKPVTATAVLQLAERGRLRLDEDVNRSLRDMQVPDVSIAGTAPVTPAALLTHTAGFDTSLIGTAVPRTAEILPLGRYLAGHLPPRVRPAGRILAYSNHGYTLLGHLVEAASGVPFPRYMEDNVLQPLGMRRSSFGVRPDLAAERATGYEPAADGRYRRAPAVYPLIVPAASLETTAADMARFLLAHLEGGSPVLRAETVARMHLRHFSQDPRMPGVAWGFFESFANGRRCLFHGGGIRGFMSGVYLWPESRLGLFVADNGYDSDLVEEVAEGLLAHEFPFRPAMPHAGPGAAERSRRCAGSYRSAAAPRGNLEKAAALRRGDLVVTDLGGGALWIWGERFVEVAPWLFQAVAGQERVAFQAGPSGPAGLLITEELFAGPQTWERVPWYASGSFNRTLLLLFTVLFLSALFIRPAAGQASLVNLPREEPPAARRAVRVGIALAALALFFLILLLLGFRQADQGAGLLTGLPPLLRMALLIPWLALPGALALPVYAVTSWRRAYWSAGWRLYFTLVALSGAGFLVFLGVWNLLSLSV
jgi:CubicO group peptidase (beta-lactamase class C family)